MAQRELGGNPVKDIYGASLQRFACYSRHFAPRCHENPFTGFKGREAGIQRLGGRDLLTRMRRRRRVGEVRMGGGGERRITMRQQNKQQHSVTIHNLGHCNTQQGNTVDVPSTKTQKWNVSFRPRKRNSNLR